MKTRTTKSETRKAGEPGCGHKHCDAKPARNAWYCWRHATEDLADGVPLSDMMVPMSPMMAGCCG